MSECRMGPARRVVWIVLLAAAGCSPTYDWREARPTGTDALAMFPCKPKTETRSVTLLGDAAPMTMVACETGGATFGLAMVELRDASRSPAAVAALRDAQGGNFAAEAKVAKAVVIPGADARPDMLRYRLDGRLPDGEAVSQHLVYFARGARVYQAAVLARKAPAEVVDTFFEGIRLLP